MDSFGAYLLERGAASIADLEESMRRLAHRGGDLGTHLVGQGVLDEEQLLSLLSEYHELPLGPAGRLPPVPDELAGVMSLDTVRQYRVFPLGVARSELHVATARPLDATMAQQLSQVVGHKVRQVLVTPLRLYEALWRYLDSPLRADVREGLLRLDGPEALELPLPPEPDEYEDEERPAKPYRLMTEGPNGKIVAVTPLPAHAIASPPAFLMGGMAPSGGPEDLGYEPLHEAEMADGPQPPPGEVYVAAWDDSGELEPDSLTPTTRRTASDDQPAPETVPDRLDAVPVPLVAPQPPRSTPSEPPELVVEYTEANDLPPEVAMADGAPDAAGVDHAEDEWEGPDSEVETVAIPDLPLSSAAKEVEPEADTPPADEVEEYAAEPQPAPAAAAAPEEADTGQVRAIGRVALRRRALSARELQAAAEADEPSPEEPLVEEPPAVLPAVEPVETAPPESTEFVPDLEPEAPVPEVEPDEYVPAPESTEYFPEAEEDLAAPAPEQYAVSAPAAAAPSLEPAPSTMPAEVPIEPAAPEAPLLAPDAAANPAVVAEPAEASGVAVAPEAAGVAVAVEAAGVVIADDGQLSAEPLDTAAEPAPADPGEAVEAVVPELEAAAPEAAVVPAEEQPAPWAVVPEAPVVEPGGELEHAAPEPREGSVAGAEDAPMYAALPDGPLGRAEAAELEPEVAELAAAGLLAGNTASGRVAPTAAAGGLAPAGATGAPTSIRSEMAAQLREHDHSYAGAPESAPAFRHRGPFPRSAAERALSEAADVNEVLEIFVRFSRQYFERSLLAVVQGGSARVRMVRGMPPELAALRVELSAPSLLQEAHDRMEPVISRLRADGPDGMLQRGIPVPDTFDAAVLPVRVRKRVVALLYADDAPVNVDPDAVGEVAAFAKLVGNALALHILRRKRLERG